MKGVLVLSFLIAGVLCQPPPIPEVGESCIPSDGPKQCGEPKLLMETSTPAVDVNGTNVCDVEKTYLVPVYSYEYEKYCKRRKCLITCESTGSCTNNKTVTKSTASCCEGFTTAQTASSKEYCSKHTCPQGKPTLETLQQEGCPRVILPTVLDCLNQLDLGLTGEAFLEMGFDVVGLNDAKISLFVPRTQLDCTSISNKRAAALLGTHIVNKTILAAFLKDGDKLETLSDGLFLHISQIKQKDEEVLFVNGIELTERDACVANNGIVHVIDDFVLAERKTIAEIMANISQISIFSDLFEAAAAELSCKLSTLFVPTDEALVEFETLGYEACLVMEQNKHFLYQFLKSHISKSAHYSSSLVLQDAVEVLSKAKRMHHSNHSNSKSRRHLIKHRNSLQVQVDNNGTILLGSDEAEVIQADIAASDGVIHLISKPLFTSMLNLEKLCTAPTGVPTSRTEPPTTGTTTRPETPTTRTNSRTEPPA